MFRRLVFENSAALFTIVAFITAASIYVMFTWRALRMKQPQVSHFENLPFETATPASSAATGQEDIAQGNALGFVASENEALKGRDGLMNAAPTGLDVETSTRAQLAS